MQLSRKHKATLFTVLLALNILLLVFNLSLSRKAATIAESYYELPSEEEQTIEELEAEIEKLKNQSLDKIESHDAINENDKFIKEFQSSKSLEELRAESAAKLAEADAEQSEGETAAEKAENDAALAAKQDEAKASNGDDSSKNIAQNHTTRRNTTISFSLKDRTPVERIPNPTYTCMGGGKIVINIVVDQFGEVVEANFNSSASNSKNGCLIDNAITYAKKALFDRNSKATQLGTITYVFQD